MTAKTYRLDEFGCAPTRKDLLNYLWEEHGLANEIAKFGTTYGVFIDGKCYATYLRNLYTLPAAEWARRIKDKYFPF